jgi:hypothetical protein
MTHLIIEREINLFVGIFFQEGDPPPGSSWEGDPPPLDDSYYGEGDPPPGSSWESEQTMAETKDDYEYQGDPPPGEPPDADDNSF